MTRPRGHVEGCGCPVCRNIDAQPAIEPDTGGGFEEEDEDTLGEGEPEPRHEWAADQRPAQPIFVDTGRGAAVEVAPGSPFVTTLERLADEHNYGGYFRIFLNGNEVVNPENSPETIEPGMRIAITSYDKVG